MIIFGVCVSIIVIFSSKKNLKTLVKASTPSSFAGDSKFSISREKVVSVCLYKSLQYAFKCGLFNLNS